MSGARAALFAATALSAVAAVWLVSRARERGASPGGRPETIVEREAERTAALQAPDPPPARDRTDEPSPASPSLPAAGPPPPPATGSMIFGTVLDRSGAPVPGRFRLTWTDPLGVERRVPVESDGTWRLSGLAEGTHWFSAAGMDLDYAEVEVEVLRGVKALRADLVLAPRSRRELATLPVRVLTSGGRAMHLALAELGVTRSSPYSFATTAAALTPGETLDAEILWRGWASASGAGSGKAETIMVLHARPVWASLLVGDRILQCVRVGSDDEEIVFRLDPESVLARLTRVTLRAVDARSGAPLEGAQVTLFSGRVSYYSVAGADGTIEIDWVPLGPAEVLVSQEDSVSRKVTIEGVPLHDLGDIGLAPLRRVRGRVVDDLGRPVPDAFVAVIGGLATGRTGGDGRFELAAPQRECSLRAVHGSRRSALLSVPASGDPASGDVEGFELVLHDPARLVLQPRSLAQPGTEWRIRDEEGRLHETGGFWGRRPARTEVAPGRYRIELVAGERTLDEVTLELEPGELEVVELGP